MATTYTTRVRDLIAGAHNRYAFPATSTETRSSSIVHRHFTVNGEARTLQARAWSDYVDRILESPVSRAQTEAGFFGEIDSYILEDLIYLDSRTDPLQQARTNAKISRDNVRDFVFHMAVEGIMETQTDPTRRGPAAQFVPGVLALDMGQTMRMRRPTPARVLAFFIPRAKVEAVIDDAESIHGKVLPYATPIGQLLQEQVLALCRHLPHLNPADAQDAIQLCADLTLVAFAKQSRLDEGMRAVTRRAQTEYIKRYIAANLHDTALSPAQVLQAFPRLPRATLYRLFESEGGLAAYIRHCRLWAAAMELIELPTTSIADIAYGLGFGSASNFSRAFKHSYGLSPLDFRTAGGHWLR
ncbi:helix-turn-helix domain-containing protein [Pararobbsia silviterrae]|uniref:Helix-turn-helix domain-containing protein n=1 Tax=Pararobbsia silviterrae TaxID=1792498 RepID=A0A494XIS6_9BURK|nr:helix-turn-helix domain-containing protein [Pararobbsia silviterrae]RKP49662.1 helix-turn-helix domain-containing protein [Pararobbsia silviterrae]